MNKFTKVSFEQYQKDLAAAVGEEIDAELAREIYDNIRLPRRATTGSAAYDFFTPTNLFLDNEYITVPTGICWECDDPNLVLVLWPRSGQGFKYGVSLRNTTGVIDSDYCHAANEGHILAKLNAEEECEIKSGTGFMQGMIIRVEHADNDTVPQTKRVGGFGSTTEVK